MGTKAAPGFANCFMGDFEEQYVYPHSTQPLKYLRFLDDIFLIWQHGRESLEAFVQHMNTRMPSIKFTMEASESQVNFLDTTVRINKTTNKIETDLYCKPTDSHNYLLYNSAHPKNCKQSIPYSQFLRIRRICSLTTDYDRHIVTLSSHFIRRGYPLDLLEKAAITARRLDRTELLRPKIKTENTSDNVILVTTYEPSQDILRNITKENWGYLGRSPLTTFIHRKKIMVGYKRPKNLRDLLVKADCKLPNKLPFANAAPEVVQNTLSATRPNTLGTPLIKKNRRQTSILDFAIKITNQNNTPTATASQQCLQTTQETTPRTSTSQPAIVRMRTNLMKNKCIARTACNYCPLLDRSGNIVCHVTGKTFPTKRNITCRSSNLIYCITCKTCNKQYVGQTKRTILARFQGHMTNINTCLEKHRDYPHVRQQEKDGVGPHFSAQDHNGTKDLIISLLAFITLPPDTLAARYHRLQVEKEWIHRMRCPAPTGLNIFD